MEEQPKWLERAKDTAKFHRSKLVSNGKWTIAKTARSLRRSYGSVVEDLMIARWCRTHEKQIEQFKHTYQALEFIRQKQAEQDLTSLDG